MTKWMIVETTDWINAMSIWWALEFCERWSSRKTEPWDFTKQFLQIGYS